MLCQLQEPKAFAGWFKQIVLSQTYRLLRDTRPLTHAVNLSQDIATLEPGPAALVENDELKEKVMTAVQALPEKEQIVTQMFYLNGYSQKEIARLLELPLTTVKKRLQYARRNLRGILVSMMDAFTPEPEPTPVPIPIPVQLPTNVYPPEPCRNGKNHIRIGFVRLNPLWFKSYNATHYAISLHRLVLAVGVQKPILVKRRIFTRFPKT